MTGDARPGAIVELRSWEDHKGQQRHSLTTRSDLPLDHQVTAEGATWLDRHLIDRDPPPLGGGFGASVATALDARADHLVDEGLARRQGQRFIFARNLIGTLRSEEHTSELQSLMRISYAVFCLKQKKSENTHKTKNTSY